MFQSSKVQTVGLALLSAAFIVLLVAAVAIAAGAYNVAGDTPHRGPVFSLLQTIRYRSIVARSSDVVVPANLRDPKRIAAGAAEYAEMCSQCHLAPGMERTEISQGLYPSAPEFARGDPLSPAQQFWVVKHGIKFTAMPAWGPTHRDDLLWDLVAFIRRLATLSPRDYRAVVKNAPEEHEHMMHGEMPSMHSDEDRGH